MSRPKNDGRGRIGGRAKGTPNKVTKERRELIAEFLDEEWDSFKEMYKKATPATKMKIYMEMMPYTTPKLAAVELKESGAPKSFKEELDDLSGEPTRE